ncbi:MAG: 30S ribosomal protein S9 [Thermaurantimonas sp.]|uniref:30S ribosomal protein S9 n=1 Tax=Thermaurantimonas sp. TaxID=2681568 RepID=UPI00391BAA92
MSITHAVGRRKTAVARVFLKEGSGNITINGRDLKSYFSTGILQSKVLQPLKLTGTEGAFDIKVNVQGGGITGQAEAIRHALSRALCLVNAEYRPALKAEGLLTRDPRMVERKKYGRKKARKRFQFSKR